MKTSSRHGRLWTAEEDSYLTAHANDPVRVIAGHLGRTVLGIRKRAEAIGVALPCPRMPSKELIAGLVQRFAAEAGCEPKDVLGTLRRTRHIAWARQQVCRELRSLGYSLIGIARALGVHHTTIMYNVGRSKRACPPPPKSYVPPPPPLRLRATPPPQRTHQAVLDSGPIVPVPKSRLMAGR